MHSKLTFALVFAAGLATALPFARSAPDQTQGMALMSAQVAQNGALIGGAGATGVSFATAGDFAYRVAFNRSIEGCTAVTTLGDMGDTSSHFPGEASISGDVDPNTVLVVTHSSAGAFTPRPFNLIVFCAK